MITYKENPYKKSRVDENTLNLDDDEDDDDNFNTFKKKKKSLIILNNNKNSAIKKTEASLVINLDNSPNNLDFQSDKNRKLEAKEEVEKLLKSDLEFSDKSHQNSNTVLNLVSDSDVSKALELRNYSIKLIQDSKNFETKVKAVDIINLNSSSSPDLIKPTLFPKVLSAAERAEKLKVESLNFMEELIGKPDAVVVNDDNADYVKLRTRIDGKDSTQKWKLVKSDPFEKLITKLSKDLDIPTKEIILLFDGETIGPGETPEGLDMEDDDLIDIKTNRAPKK